MNWPDRSLVAGVGRGAGGALIFAIPMIMTMEMWSLGHSTNPLRLAILLAIAPCLLIGLARYVGFRETSSLIDHIADSMIAIGIAAVMAASFLALFGLVALGMSTDELVGRIAIQVVPASIGAMLSRSLLGEQPEGAERRRETEGVPPRGRRKSEAPDFARRKATTSGARGRTARRKRGETTSPWEWAAAAFGAGIFVLLAGFLVYAGLSRPPSPQPDIAAHAGRAIRLDSGNFLVPISVRNLGHDTCANVTVRGSLRDQRGALIEESSATFDYVAQHSETAGGLFFTADPGTGVLTVRAEGYADP